MGTEETPPRRSNGLHPSSSKKSLSEKSSPRTRWLIPLLLPEVREPPVLSRDSVSTDFQERELLPLERLCFHKPLPSPPSSPRSNSSIPPPRSVTVNSKPSKRRKNSWDHLPPSKRPSELILNESEIATIFIIVSLRL